MSWLRKLLNQRFFKNRSGKIILSETDFAEDPHAAFWFSMRSKIERMAKLDPPQIETDLYRYPARHVFGANSHEYELSRLWSGARIAKFEAAHDIILPEKFQSMLKIIGSPAAGPDYGIYNFENLNVASTENLRRTAKIEYFDGVIDLLDDTDPRVALLEDDSFDDGLLYIGQGGNPIEYFLAINGSGRGQVLVHGAIARWVTLEDFFLNWADEKLAMLEKKTITRVELS